MTQRARIVLVGTGRMGDIRARLMYSNPKIDLCGIVDINSEAASAMASLYQVRPAGSVQLNQIVIGAEGEANKSIYPSTCIRSHEAFSIFRF